MGVVVVSSATAFLFIIYHKNRDYLCSTEGSLPPPIIDKKQVVLSYDGGYRVDSSLPVESDLQLTLLVTGRGILDGYSRFSYFVSCTFRKGQITSDSFSFTNKHVIPDNVFIYSISPSEDNYCEYVPETQPVFVLVSLFTSGGYLGIRLSRAYPEEVLVSVFQNLYPQALVGDFSIPQGKTSVLTDFQTSITSTLNICMALPLVSGIYALR